MPGSGPQPGLGVVVVGMHRSGTSMLSHLLGALGFSFGGDLVQPAPDNPLGYWEHAEVVTTHETFLALLRRSWDDVRRFPAGAFDSAEARVTRRRLGEIFARDFAERERWVLKDPRLCRLLPLWSEVFADPRADVRLLHVVRHPLSVAASLAARDGFATARSLLLWLRHNLDAERASRGWTRAWVRWEELSADPAPALGRAFAALGLDGSFGDDELAAAAGEVLERGAIHHRASGTAELESTFPWIHRASRAFDLLVEGRDEEAAAILDEVDATMAASERQLLFPATTAEVDDDSAEGRAQQDTAASLERFRRSFGRRQEELLGRFEAALEGLTAQGGVVEALGGLADDLQAHRAHLDESGERFERGLNLVRSTDRRLLAKSLELLEESEEGRKRERGRQREELEALRDRHAAELEGLEELEEQRRQDAAELEEQRRQDAAELEELRRQHAAERARGERLGEEAQRLAGLLADVFASRSWRLTRPIRELAAWLRGGAATVEEKVEEKVEEGVEEGAGS